MYIFGKMDCCFIYSAISCDEISAPENGQVVYNVPVMIPPYAFGTIATFICNDGYGVFGAETSRCQGDGSSHNGVWNAIPPTCTGEHTFRMSINKILYIKYNCLIGEFIITAITCLGLSSPTNGQISYFTDMTIPFDFGTVATYSCEDGYGLSGGDMASTCGGDYTSITGVWSGTPPTCESKLNLLTTSVVGACLLLVINTNSIADITCSALSPISNGTITYVSDISDPFDFGTTATITCDIGFNLGGDSTRTCSGDGLSPNGMWSGNAPICSGIHIEVPICNFAD